MNLPITKEYLHSQFVEYNTTIVNPQLTIAKDKLTNLDDRVEALEKLPAELNAIINEEEF